MSKATDDQGQTVGRANAEAVAWVARLHQSDRTTAVDAGLRRWLAAHPENARAFERATETWERAGNIPRQAFPLMIQQRKAPRLLTPWRLSAIAAAVAVCTAAVLWARFQSDEMVTRLGEQRTLALEDGSRVLMNSGTRVEVLFDADVRRIRLNAGEAYFDVAKDARRPFVVDAGEREILALGTAFLVRREPGSLAVTLVEGKVTVASVALVPGQRVTFISDAPPQMDQPVIEKVTAWQRGEVVFDGTRLQDAVAELNRYSTLRLSVDSQEAADLRVSGIVRVGDSSGFARAIAETYGLQVAEKGKQLVLSGVPVAK